MNMDFGEIMLKYSDKYFQQQNSKGQDEQDKYEKAQQLQKRFNSYLQDHRRKQYLLGQDEKRKEKFNFLDNQIRNMHQQKEQQYFQNGQDQYSKQPQIKQKKSDFKLFNRKKSKSTHISNIKQDKRTTTNNKKQLSNQKPNRKQTNDQKLSGSLFINKDEIGLSQSRKKSQSLFQMGNQLKQMEILMKEHIRQKQLVAEQLLREIQIQKTEKCHLFQINQKLQEELCIIQNQYNNQNKSKFITNDQELNNKLIEVQRIFESIKHDHQKIKKQNIELRRQQNTLKQTLKIAIDNRKKWMIMEKEKCQSKFTTYKAKQMNVPSEKRNIVQEQQQLLRRLVGQFQKLKELVDKKTVKKKLKR